MSRLHDPGPGDILDRLTILALKIVHGKQAGRDTAPWDAEFGHLIAVHDGDAIAHLRMAQHLELGAVNSALWQAEDEMRECRRRTGNAAYDAILLQTATSACGMKIQSLNDRRAALITLLNGGPSDKV